MAARSCTPRLEEDPAAGDPQLSYAERADDLGERISRMAADEFVDVRKGRRHATGERSEAWRRNPGVGPYDAMRMQAQCGHLTGEDARVIALPAIGDDQHDGTARHPPPAMEVHELA